MQRQRVLGVHCAIGCFVPTVGEFRIRGINTASLSTSLLPRLIDGQKHRYMRGGRGAARGLAVILLGVPSSLCSCTPAFQTTCGSCPPPFYSVVTFRPRWSDKRCMTREFHLAVAGRGCRQNL